MKFSQLKNVFFCLMALAMASNSWAWGTKGHEIIEEVAVDLLPNDSDLTRLLKHNIRAMKFLSMVPDLAWKHGAEPHPLEGQSHYFQIDFYSPRGGELKPDINFYLERAGDPRVLVKEGTAPWRVEQMAWLLIKTLKKNRPSPLEILQVAATMGHYVGDIGNPLHVSTDYDGVQIGEKGLHSFFETVTVDELPTEPLVNAVTRSAAGVLQSLPPRPLRPISGAFALAKTADFNADIVLSTAKSLGKTQGFKDKMRPVIVQTLGMSAAVLAKLWSQAYVLAGSPEFSTDNLGKVPIPDWVPITYIPGI